MNSSDLGNKPSVKERFREEMRKFAILSVYLFVCFYVLMMYQASGDPATGIHYVPVSIALIKALVIGKFILIGEAIKVGSRGSGPTLIHRIAWKSLAFLMLLIVFNIIEEIVVGWFHDRTMAQSVAELFDRPVIEILAPIMVMLLILIPLVSLLEISKALGPDKFRALFLERDGSQQ